MTSKLSKKGNIESNETGDFQIFHESVEIKNGRSADDDVGAELFVQEMDSATLFVGDATDDEDDDASVDQNLR